MTLGTSGLHKLILFDCYL